MSDLHLVRLALDRRALLRSVRKGAWDESYLLHVALSQVFAHSPHEKASVPLLTFCIDDTYGGVASETDLLLLGYSDLDESALHSRMGPAASALVKQCVSREVPRITAGTVIHFRTRICPVVRVKRNAHGQQAKSSAGRPRSREVDAWLASRFPEWSSEPPPSEAPFERASWEWSQREATYTEWLSREIASGDRGERRVREPAAVLEGDTTRMEAFQRVRMHRRGGGRPLGRPDAILTGHLRVGEEDGFRAVLRRGLGRHRAFGFGMLRVRPSR